MSDIVESQESVKLPQASLAEAKSIKAAVEQCIANHKLGMTPAAEVLADAMAAVNALAGLIQNLSAIKAEVTSDPAGVAEAAGVEVAEAVKTEVGSPGAQ